MVAESFVHETVLREEAVERLAPRDGGVYVDASVGGGGHSEHLLERSAPGGRVLGLDRDERALRASSARLARFGERARLLRGDAGAWASALGALHEEAPDRWPAKVDGLLFDAGVSSPQLDEASRGFSLRQDGPLDMRMGEGVPSLAERLAVVSAQQLATWLRDYGEVPRAGRLASGLLEAFHAGKIGSTGDLARWVAERWPRGVRFGGGHPAAQVFQALRIAVNDELGQLESLLTGATNAVAPGGRVVVISFHSLEDRLVKQTMSTWTASPAALRGVPLRDGERQAPWRWVARRVRPSDAECARNPRARSAVLRAVERVRAEVG